MEQQLEDLIEYLISLELIEQEGNYIQLSLLGRAVGGSALSFDSAMRLVNLLQTIQSNELTVEKLIALLQLLPESDGGYTPMMKRGRQEAIRPHEATKRYGNATVQVLKRLARDEFDYYARCKRASLLWDWVNGEPIETIEQRYSPNSYQGKIGYGDVQRFADATRLHLRSAHQIASLIRIGQSPAEETIEAMLKQLEIGIPSDALDLLTISLRLARGEYLALYGVGIKTSKDFWALLKDEISEILGQERASQLEALRPVGN